MKHKQIVMGEYVFTPCKNAFNNKTSYWLSKDGYHISVYAFTPWDNENLKEMTTQESLQSYISYFNEIIKRMKTKVIVTYRHFHDIDREEIPPEVFRPNENETAEEALQRIWEDQYNGLLAEKNNDDCDPLDEERCWHEEDRAMITWADGDTKEFYIIEVTDYD